MTQPRIVDAAALDAARACGAPDVDLHLHEGAYHEAHNDLDRDAFLRHRRLARS